MGTCYSTGHTAKAMHTDITTCSTEEPQQKYRLGTVRTDYWGDGGRGLNIFSSGSTHLVCMKVSYPSIINTGNKQTNPG